ncbi:hypothetical protein LCGC14_1696400 [marine sediment metagenome]|uniref:TNase-like domain-containing protein n=1 Tax=marine sediment metagenome TaxID=412755 RepID=A0A0F9HJ27_9ZZZZ
MIEHDFVKEPELRNNQLNELLGFMSPHKQIIDDFWATVVKVTDGDTITLRTDFRDFDFPLRFLGVNAPELSEGGDEAKEWLTTRLLGKTVYIALSKERVEKWGRLLGKVISEGLDVSEELVMRGFAVPWDNRHDGKIRSPIKPISEVLKSAIA